MTTPSAYAQELYAQPAHAARLPADLTQLEDRARAVMAPEAFGYVAGAAGTGATARANRAALDAVRFVPRILTGATDRTVATTLFGRPSTAPVAAAPLAAQTVAHADGELAIAAEAAAAGIPLILSTLSSRPLEEVAAVNGGGQRWFQLYRPNDDELCLSFLSRARAAGFHVLVVTVDNWTFGWRPQELDRGFLPFEAGHGVGTYFTDPVFRSRLPRAPEHDLAGALGAWHRLFGGVDRTWDDLAFLRANWQGPIVVKGVQHPDDARRAVDVGMDGVVVSNHGGRQVDGAAGALDALRGVVDAVGDRATVLFDSGVRTGADVAKAVALGAAAALIGRPYVFGLALAGRAGVRHVLRSVLAELDLTVALTGHRRVTDLGRATLQGGAGSDAGIG